MKRRMTKRIAYQLTAHGETITTTDPDDVAYAREMVPTVQVKAEAVSVLVLS